MCTGVATAHNMKAKDGGMVSAAMAEFHRPKTR